MAYKMLLINVIVWKKEYAFIKLVSFFALYYRYQRLSEIEA